jgi:hypothetical protein
MILRRLGSGATTVDGELTHYGFGRRRALELSKCR